jgi:signal transduction histidine kinase
MISLVPSWTQHYDEFWNTLRRRNLWLIKLRYGAVVMLLLVLFIADFIISIKLSPTQHYSVLLIITIIFLYNILLHYLRKFVVVTPGGFNPIHHSIIQMLLDIISLFLLVYFTGTIESPMFLLFVFHMIIGSLILPGIVIYSIAAGIVIIFSLMVSLEYKGILYHHSISGFLAYPVYTNFNYIISFTVFFAFLIFISVLLANRIARQLYRNEQMLVESIEKLNKAEEEKQKYIMGVVHELKSPVAAVQSYIQLILQKYLGPLNDKVEQKLNAAGERADEAIRMINNILNISRLRLTDEITMESIDLREVICLIVEKQKPEIDAKQITVKINDKNKSKFNFRGNRFLIELAVSNILLNAVKYVGVQGLIDISLTSENEGPYLDISDNGIGIPQEEQKKVFKEFYRASNIKNRGYEGTGLGLSIVQQIIKRHGGSITVESPGRLKNDQNPGSTFRIFLPYQISNLNIKL